MGRHALLSASSSHRWLACPPSARLCENYEDTGSEYAQQGTDAHSLCEHKLKLSLGMESEDPTEGLSFYDEEMEECACGYAEYVLSLVEEAKKICKDPVVLIEQRLDFSRYVEEGFGTGDCVIIADGTLYIIDYKHGKGVEVSAEGNPQMMLYALGALELFDGIYDIESVRMAIYQPRRENVSVYAMAKGDLLKWAEGEHTEKAKLAYAGEGEFCAGEHCKFCKAKAVYMCRGCAKLNYASQQKSGMDELRLKMERIAEQLDYQWWRNDFDCIADVYYIPKPHYMRWAKYEKLMQEFRALQKEYERNMEIRLMKAYKALYR